MLHKLRHVHSNQTRITFENAINGVNGTFLYGVPNNKITISTRLVITCKF